MKKLPMKQYHIAVIPGDGIGKEVIHEGIRVVDAAGSRFGFQMNLEFFDWSCAYYQKHGRMMPPDGIAQLAAYDAIFLGAVGFPGVPDHLSLMLAHSAVHKPLPRSKEP